MKPLQETVWIRILRGPKDWWLFQPPFRSFQPSDWNFGNFLERFGGHCLFLSAFSVFLQRFWFLKFSWAGGLAISQCKLQNWDGTCCERSDPLVMQPKYQMQIPWHLHEWIFLFCPCQEFVERLATSDIICVSVQPEGDDAIPGGMAMQNGNLYTWWSPRQKESECCSLLPVVPQKRKDTVYTENYAQQNHPGLTSALPSWVRLPISCCKIGACAS